MKTLWLYTLIGVLMVTCMAHARDVDILTAERAAAGWLSEAPIRLGDNLDGSIRSISPYLDERGNCVGYVASLKEGGFVIVSANDLIEPIIAFSDTGSAEDLLDEENPLAAMLNLDLPERLAIARSLDRQYSAGRGLNGIEQLPDYAKEASSKWNQIEERGLTSPQYNDTVPDDTDPRNNRESREQDSVKNNFFDSIPNPEGSGSIDDVRVDTFMDSRWNQRTAQGYNCYNYYTPSHYYCGCVATAMAQLMRYYQFPTAAIGIHTNTIRVSGSPQSATTRGGDGSGGAYNWSLMPLVPSTATYNESQWAMIGALCYDAGVGAEMSYSSGGSSADLNDAKYALSNMFGYASAQYIYYSSGMSATNFRYILDSNLAGLAPVIMGVSRSGGGHAVVADGFGYSSETPYHHINMGWGGNDDAWYNLPTIDAYYTYNVVDCLIFNVFPTNSGEMISGRVLDDEGNAVSGATVSATPSGGGATRTATSDSHGYYGIIVPSAATYDLEADDGSGLASLDDIPVSTSYSYMHEGAKGGCGNYYGADLVITNYSFTFGTLAQTNSITLTWSTPDAAGFSNNTVMVRWNAGAYPTATNDANLLYSGTNTTTTHTNLTPGQWYYYRVWVSHNGSQFIDPGVGTNMARAYPHRSPIQLLTRCSSTFEQGGKTKTQCRTLFFNDEGSGCIQAALSATPFNLAVKWTIAGCGDFNPARAGKEVLLTDSSGTLFLLYFDALGNLYWNADTNDLCWTSYTLGATYSTNAADWTVDAIGDINADGMDELIMRCSDTFSQGGKTKSYTRVLFFDDSGSGQLEATQPEPFAYATTWTIAGLGNFNTAGVGGTDPDAKQICLQHGSDGGFYLLYLNDNGTLYWNASDTNDACWTSWSPGSIYATNAPSWAVAAVGDINGDEQDELLVNCSNTFSEGGKTKSYKNILFFTDNGSGTLKETQPAAFKTATSWSLEGLGNFNSTNTISPASADQLLLQHATDGGYYLLYFETNGTLYWNAGDTNDICWTSWSPGSGISTNATSWSVQALGDILGN